MNTLGKAELTAPLRHIGRFLKSGAPICNSKVPNTAVRKNKKREKKTLCISRKRKKLSFGAKILNFRISKPGLIIS